MHEDDIASMANEWLNYDDFETSADSSFPTTFAGYFSKEIGKSLESYFSEIGSIWLNMGIPVSKRDEKVGELRDAILNQVKKFQENETNELDKQRNYRDYQLGEINKILKALSLEVYVLDSSKSLLAQNKILHLKYKEMLAMKNERMEHLQRITDKLKRVFHSLGLQFEDPIFATNIPSELELMNLRSSLMNHEQTLDTRKKRFESLKSIVLKYQKGLEYTPQNSKEQSFLTSNDTIYSQESMVMMQDFHKKITSLYNQANSEVENLKKKLFQLFDRLDVDENERKAFLQTLNGTIVRNKQLLQIEIEKYEILKKSSMEKIILSIRKDIDELFLTCMIRSFNESIFDSQDFTEELLILHETEFAKLSKFNQFYGGVFDKLREWEDSLQKLFELEKKLLDPNRFNNRGGALLQNERERRILSKKLPKLEKEIKSLVTMIESKENIPFNSYGLEIDEYFSSNWDQFKDSAKVIVAKKSGGDSSKKSATLSSQKKSRYPLSPRMNSNQAKRALNNNNAARALFTPGQTNKTRFELENEFEFQKHLKNQDILHSTILDNDNRIISSQSKLIRTPTSVNLRNPTRNLANRRLSKSYDDLTKITGKVGPSGITKRLKKPPFLP